MLLGMKKRNSDIQSRKSVLAWMLVFMLSAIVGCGGQSGNDGNLENPADMAEGAENQTDAVMNAENGVNADGETVGNLQSRRQKLPAKRWWKAQGERKRRTVGQRQ